MSPDIRPATQLDRVGSRRLKLLAPRVAPYRFSPDVAIVIDQWPGWSSANTYLVGNKKSKNKVLIDGGGPGSYDELEHNLDQLGVRVNQIDAVVVTHGHIDHIGGVPEIRRRKPDVRVFIHEDDRKAVETGDRALMATSLLESNGQRVVYEPFPVDQEDVLHGGEILDFGKYKLQVIPLPGHTPGSIGIATADNNKRIIFAGDAVYGQANTTAADLDIWDESLRVFEEQDFDAIYNGHMPIEHLPVSTEHFRTQILIFRQLKSNKPFDPWRAEAS